jgi:hypothetical protein
MPDDKVIHFSKADYDKLIKVVTDDEGDLDNKFLKPGPGMMFDDSLPNFVKPGVDTWDPCKLIKTGCKTFGGSVSEKFGKLDNEWLDFIKSLKNVSDVFTNCDDLAKMTAQDFRDKYPDFGADGWSSGGGGQGKGNS